ncbi:hypothetical protein SFC88_16480 [Nocardioides sp. HM23]|nr:hypothetical protein [Nocardioides sp. HM23]MDZ5622442.1 hypothetical protein [Nocardioides sp. HM23]
MNRATLRSELRTIDDACNYFLRNKRAEWDKYRGQVSAFERDRMQPVL